MCGLSGFFSSALKFKEKNASNYAEACLASLKHRGPDDNGYWVDYNSGIMLAHTRLAIVDLSEAGHQPMASACDRFMISFNGEIYNHLELRKELEEENSAPVWKGHSDTETLLACFSAWGIERTLKATVGMFAIALWDKQEHQLTLARDRVGEKPLYWGWQNDTLLFGSELKALKVHPDFSADINRDAICLLMRHNYIPAPHTIYTGIYKLMPGHFITFPANSNNNTSVSNPYWSMNTVIESGLSNPFQGSQKESTDRLEAIISTSIRDQMLSDVPLGAFLSGGVDSSLIVSLMQKFSSRPVKTYAIGFEDERFNEAPYAAAVAKHLGTEHTDMYVSEKDILDLVPSLSDIYCEPFADSSQLPTIMVAKMARQHVTVALSGDAGDELFGGYTPYQFTPRYWNKVQSIPLNIRTIIAKYITNIPLPQRINKLATCMDAATQEEFYRRIISHWQAPESIVLDGKEPATMFSSPTLWPQNVNFVEWMMATDAQVYMTDDILVKVDRASMYSSLETRVPLLDHRIIEFAWQLPLDYKIKNGTGKIPLRDILYRHVPRELIERPKKGFSVPLAAWLRGPLKQWAESLLDAGRLNREGYFNTSVIRARWEQHLSGKMDYSRQLWNVLMFQAWLEKNH